MDWYCGRGGELWPVVVGVLGALTGGQVVGGFVLDCYGGCLLDSGSSGIGFLV